MTSEELFALMREPRGLSEHMLPDLRYLVEAYPYCASFIFLYLYALSETNDVRYASELRRLAIYLPARQELYRLVEQMEDEEALPQEPEAEHRDGFGLIDSFLSEARAAGADLPAELTYTTTAQSSDYFATEAVPTTTPFTALTTRASTETSSAPSSLEEDEGDDLAEELFTETLAKIYVKQGRYDKALRIINAISLNYPKKNRYFADQIRFLERLIENNKEQ